MMNAADVRKEWSSVMDKAVRERPEFIRHNQNEMILASLTLFESVLAACKYTAHKMLEDDGSVTLLLDELDLVENGLNEFDAKYALAKSILEYAEDFYDNFYLYSLAPIARDISLMC